MSEDQPRQVVAALRVTRDDALKVVRVQVTELDGWVLSLKMTGPEARQVAQQLIRAAGPL